jgi:hypothetical protein
MSEVAYDVPRRVDPLDVMLDFVLSSRVALTAAGALAPAALLDKNVALDLPSTGLVGRLPFVWVQPGPGADTDRFESVADVDVHVFAATYPVARNLAFGLESRLLGYPFRVSTGGRSVLVDRVTVAVPAAEVEWQQDSAIRRFQGTYQISNRR